MGPPQGLEVGDASASPSHPLELLLPSGLNLYNFSFFLLKTNNLFLIKQRAKRTKFLF